MDLGGHDIVRMAGEDCNTVAGRAVPDTNGLVVGARELVIRT